MVLKWAAKISESHGQTIKKNELHDEHSHKLAIQVEGDLETLKSIKGETATIIIKTGGQQMLDNFFETED